MNVANEHGATANGNGPRANEHGAEASRYGPISKIAGGALNWPQNHLLTKPLCFSFFGFFPFAILQFCDACFMAVASLRFAENVVFPMVFPQFSTTRILQFFPFGHLLPPAFAST